MSLKGVHKVKRKRADGSYTIHYYAWRGKGAPKLDPDHPEGLMGSYCDLLKKKRDSNIFAEIIDAYQLSPGHKNKTKLWRWECETMHKKIGDQFGEYDLSLFSEPEMRGEVLDWRDSLEIPASQADKLINQLVGILNWAMDRGRIGWHCCSKIEKLHTPTDRSHIIWDDIEIDLLCTAMNNQESINLIRLAVATGLDLGDLIKLPWSAIRAETIETKRSKTKGEVSIPITPEIDQLLKTIPNKSPIILTNSKGRPFTADGFKSVFQRAKAKAGISGKTFKDFRGTACTRLMMQFPDLSDNDLALLMGWSEKSVKKVRRFYISKRDVSASIVARIGNTKRTKL